MGSCVPAAPVLGGITITGVTNNASVVSFLMAGNQVGVPAFISLTVNGNTYLRASANNPGGAVSGANTQWQWNGNAGITVPNAYPTTAT